MSISEVEKFNFDYYGDNSAYLLIKALVDIGFKYFGVEEFFREWKHDPYIFEAQQMVIFGLNNKSNVIKYSVINHLFYWSAIDSDALTICDPNIKDLESLICLYMK